MFLTQNLQKALQSDASESKREAALTPLLDAFHERLIRFARQKMRQSTRSLGLDVEDLVQEAWTQLFLRLQNPQGVPFRDDDHTFYFLRRVILTRFLDAIDKQPTQPVYELDAPIGDEDESGQVGSDLLVASSATRAEGSLFFATEGVREQLLHALFESDEAFRAVCTHPPRRRVKQYQAAVLYYLLQMIQEMAGESLAMRQDMLRRMGELIGIPIALQDRLILVLKHYLSEEDLLVKINDLCETKVEHIQNFGKLRYELNQLCGNAEKR
jgi:DNA-directed RNA polymerase specialized sigma24 family protein